MGRRWNKKRAGDLMPVAIKISPFGPIQPRTAERKLNEGFAQLAGNLNLLSGELRPIKTPALVGGTTALHDSLAVYRAEYLTTEKWRGWTTDTDIVLVPLAIEATPRYAWTGDGPPKHTSFADFLTTASDLTLGIPTPIFTPGVAVVGGASATTSRLYVYTFFSQNGEESGPSPASALTTGFSDATASWNITLMNVAPVNGNTIVARPATLFVTPTNTFPNATGAAVSITSSTNASPSVITRAVHGFLTGDRIFITGHTTNTAIDNTPTNPTWIVVRIDANNLSLTSEAGVAVNGAGGAGGATGNMYQCTPHWLRAADQLTVNSVAYTVGTVASAYSFTVSTTTDLSTFTSWARVANWNTTGMTKRLYRSAGTNATYQLVAENIAVTSTTYSDTILDTLIPGDELISDGWKPPPTSLFGLCALPNGAFVGVSGASVYFSEPYQPHAWPDAYQFGMGFTAVGVATFGTTAVIGTLGKPYFADGVEPASVTLQSIDSVWPCLSKRSMVSVGDGVIYATLHGLAYLGSAGPKIWSQPYYTREQWRAIEPSSMISAATEAKIFVRYKVTGSPDSHILVFVPEEPLAALTTLDINCTELYADPRDGFLYIVDATAVKQYDTGVGNRLVYDWFSKEYELPKPVNLGFARVEFVSETTAADVAAAQALYNAAVAANVAAIAAGVGAINGGQGGYNSSSYNGYTPALPVVLDSGFVTFTLYSKGVAVFSALLYDTLAFTLPAGYTTDAVSFRLAGTVRVKNIKVAETSGGLSSV